MSAGAFADRRPGETPVDVSELLTEGISTRAQLSEAEARNIASAFEKYFGGESIKDLAPFDFSWTVTLHREMFGEVWGWAGRFRTEDLNIGCPWQQIRERLYNLLEDLRCWDAGGVELAEQAARLHHGAVAIHPFPNGNGRWSRALANIWMAVHDAPVILWPERMIGEISPIRGDYLAALKSADEGDLGPLIALHRRFRDEG
jgi:Fic-DOC domain mobile mystery protein B